MKRFLVLVSLLFSNEVYANVINLHFVNEDNSTFENKTCTIGGDIILPTNQPVKRGHIFVGWKAPEYTPIEYIENVPESYFNSGYSADNNTKVVADFECVATSGFPSGCTVIGPVYYAQSQFFINSDYAGHDSGIDDITVKFGSTQKSFQVGNTRRLVVLSKEGLLVNDQKLMDEFPETSFKSPALYVLNSKKCTLRLYSLQIYQNNILLHDYVPAFDRDGTACLYDKVDKQFLYNAGTNEFIAGPITDYD